MNKTARVLAPRSGWSAFAYSQAVTQFLWERCGGWRYMNPTSNTSIWEEPSGSGGSIYVAYKGDDVVEFVIESTNSAEVSEIATELERRFGIGTVDSDDAG